MSLQYPCSTQHRGIACWRSRPSLAAAIGFAAFGVGLLGCGEGALIGSPDASVAPDVLGPDSTVVVIDPTIDPDYGKYPDAGADETDAFVEPCTPATFYRDADGDRHGVADDTVVACEAPAGYVEKAGDCDDADSSVHPEAPEVCNARDDDCDDLVDEDLVKRSYFRDLDNDGEGGPSFEINCRKREGYVEESGDCDDHNPTRFHGAPEQCNGLDDDCDGLIDDDLAPITSYRDDDGDGWAVSENNFHVGCNIPAGPWVLAKDADGDGEPDWDCDDSNTTVHPGAPTVCGDGIDNNCDGDVDRLCFTSCGGRWAEGPYKLKHGTGIGHSRVVDLDGDGHHEIIVQDKSGLAILDREGVPLFEDTGTQMRHNISRGLVVVADIDDYDSFQLKNQTLEVLTATGRDPTFYRLNVDRSVSEFKSPDNSYDASRMMAADLDRDGVVEFFTSTWCGDATRIYRFDRGAERIELAARIADPDGACHYANGRSLTDLDGDGTLELVGGSGYARDDVPIYWQGDIHALRFTDPAKLLSADFCPTNDCFPTQVAGLFGGGVAYLFRIGDELRAQTLHFETKVGGLSNRRESRFWRYNVDGQPPKTGQPLDGSPSTVSSQYVQTTDVNRDGKPEDYGWLTASLGLFDVDGDGMPDRVHSAGTELRLSRWDAESGSFVSNAGSGLSVASTPVAVRSAWDIDGDGRLEVISSDQQGNVYCHKMGHDSWNREAVLPPRFPLFQRTYQWDNYEPNEGVDEDGDGLPDQLVRVPSALTNRGEFHSYLSSADDKDYYLVNSGWGGKICLTAPAAAALELKLFSYRDRWNNKTRELGADGKPDGLFWSGTVKAGTTRCVTPSNPHRYGEYKFVVGVESVDGSASPYWPYWIEARK